MKKNDILKLEILENIKEKIEEKIIETKKDYKEEMEKPNTNIMKINKIDGKSEVLHELLGYIESEIKWTNENSII